VPHRRSDKVPAQAACLLTRRDRGPICYNFSQKLALGQFAAVIGNNAGASIQKLIRQRLAITRGARVASGLEQKLRVAILEDDPDQAELVGLWLTHAEHTVDSHADAASFLRAVRHDSFDMYLLDWVLPDLSGIEVLRKLRREMDDYTPTIIVTARDEEQSIVRGLEAGADDYLVKPVRQAELVARISAVLRRAAGGKPEEEDLDVAPYSLSFANKTVGLNGEKIRLTNREFELALFFFRNAGKMISRNHLLESIWGIENKSVSTRTVDTHVSRLRKKLKLGEENGWKLSRFISTATGWRESKRRDKC
jgi:DNA-binding response OmpR family regulator